MNLNKLFNLSKNHFVGSLKGYNSQASVLFVMRCFLISQVFKAEIT